jgi:signal transduction histidine kinase
MAEGNISQRRAVGDERFAGAPEPPNGAQSTDARGARGAGEGAAGDRRRGGTAPLPQVGGDRVLAGVVVTAMAITLLVTILPFARLAYRDPAAHIAIDTAGAVICTLAAYLLFERFSRTALVGDLLLFTALGVFAAANLGLSVVPALTGAGSDAIPTWGVFCSRLFGMSLLVAAAFAPPRTIRMPRANALVAFGVCAVAVSVLTVLMQAFGADLPEVIDATLSPESSARPRIVGHPSILAGQLVAMLLFAVAAGGFARRTARRHEELLRWVAIGAVLAAFARLNYFLFPSLYTEYFYTGDLFRMGFYLALLVGGLREIGAYQRALADGAVLEERRRIARDLHDGLAQDLAFITSQARALARAADVPPRLEDIASAAERALDDSRAAIAALTRPLDEPLDQALARSAHAIADRCGIRVELDLAPGVDAPPAVREALARIVREATSNAVRHGEASGVTVRLARGDELRLTISDDGAGFDPARPRRRAGGGFGLISMRERTEALGGRFSVQSRPGAGTRVEVVLP